MGMGVVCLEIASPPYERYRQQILTGLMLYDKGTHTRIFSENLVAPFTDKDLSNDKRRVR